MKEKKNLAERIAGNKIYQGITCVVLIIVLVGGYCVIDNRLNKVLTIIENDFSWVYQVDEIKQDAEYLIVKGWAFELGQNAVGNNYEIVLQDIDTKKFFFPEMFYEERTDVNEYFLCEYDYESSGYVAKIPLKKLDLEDGIYQVLLRLKGIHEAYAMDFFYANNQMLFVDPREFHELEVRGTDLEEVVENGFFRTYSKKYQTYVYQYNGELYWITEGDYNCTEGDWYVRYQMETTQIQNLPQKRLDNSWYWSNMGFYFSKNEVTSLNAGKYRVAKCVLPTEYSVTRIWTGNHDDRCAWRSDFYPWYEFK